MTKQELATAIASWEETFLYHLGNYATATKNGAINSAERSFQEAAQAAAILTALKAMRP